MSPRRIVGLGLIVLCSWMAVHADAASIDDEVTVYFKYKDADGGEAPRLLGRTSILVGRIEFTVEAGEPARHEVLEVQVQSDAALFDGRPGELCRGPATGGCVFDFGNTARGHRLTLVASVADPQRRPLEPTVLRVSTLRVNAADGAGVLGGRAIVERSESRTHPHDHVSRSVRVTRVEGRGRSTRRVSLLDLTRDAFVAEAKGLGEVEIVSLQPPAPDRACVVPLVWNVGPYFKSSPDGLVWTKGHEKMVRAIREGFRVAADAGFDCESLVVEYASVGRPLFGPFRLHPGKQLSAEERADNQRILDALATHLQRAPRPEWEAWNNTAAEMSRRTDFLSVYHTLNDLLRGYPGLKNLLLLTDGNDATERSELTFQHDLWPLRIEKLNPNWSSERIATVLHGLDFATGEYDDQLATLIAELDHDDPKAAGKVAAFMGRVDPGGLSALHPHRKDVWPPVDVLLHYVTPAPQHRRDVAAIAPMTGGMQWLLDPTSAGAGNPADLTVAARDSGSELTLGQALLAVAAHIRQAYVVELVVPNPSQDGRGHELAFRLRRPSGKVEIHYMPTYVSSPPQEQKIRVYVASPFKELRLFAAYRLREFPFNDAFYDLLRRRWGVEEDGQVRRVLFESWVSLNLQRLQVLPDQIASARQRRDYANASFSNLTNLTPAEHPDPQLVTDARLVTERYRGYFPERF